MPRGPAQNVPLPPSRLPRDVSNANLTLSYTGGVAAQSAVESAADLDELFTPAMNVRPDRTPRSLPSGHPSHSIPSLTFAAAFPGHPSLSNYVISSDSDFGSQDPSSEARQSIDLSADHSRTTRHPDLDLPWNPLQATEASNKAPLPRTRQLNSTRPPKTPNRSTEPFPDFSVPGSFHDSALGTLTGPSHDETQSLLSSPLTEMNNAFHFRFPVPSQPEEVYPADEEEESEPQTAHEDQPRKPQRPQRPPRNKEEPTCEICGHVSKTQSDAKKHLARHENPFKCSIPDCARSQKGFATLNDLHRHEKSVHNTNARGSRNYKCFAPNCPKAEKEWPRLDNFKQHLVRMHPDQTVDDLVQQSNDWYESYFGEGDPVQSAAVASVLRRQEEEIRRESQQKKRRRNSTSPNPEPSQKRATLNSVQTQGMQYPPSDPSRVSPLSAQSMSRPPPPSFHQRPNQPATLNPMQNVRWNPPQMQRFLTQAHLPGPSRPTGPSIPYQRRDTEGQVRPQMPIPSQQELLFQHVNPPFYNMSNQPQMTQSAYDQQSQGHDVPNRDQTQPRAHTAPDRNADYNQIRMALIDDTHPLPPGQDDLEIMNQYLAEWGAGTVVPQSSPSTSNGPHTPSQATRVANVAVDVEPEGDDGKVKALTDRFADELRAWMSQHGTERKERHSLLSTEDFPRILEFMASRSSRGTTSELGVSGKSVGGHASTRAGKTNYICSTCHKYHTRRSELKKHEKRHSRPYGCVLDNCYKRFGSKNDLKRHETKLHPEQKECYRCDGTHKGTDGRPCRNVFYRGRDSYKKHLLTCVTEDPHRVEMIANERRIPAGNQGRFWCGFCDTIVSHDKTGQDAFNFRLTHIDSHFSRGQKAAEWIELGGKGLTKARVEMQQNMEKNLIIDARGMEVEQHTEESESQATSSSSSPNSRDDADHSQSNEATKVSAEQRPESQKPQRQASNAAQYSSPMSPPQFHQGRNQQQMGQAQQMQRGMSQGQGQRTQQKSSFQDPPRAKTYNKFGQRVAHFADCCLCGLEWPLDLGRRCTSCGHDLCDTCKKRS